MDSDAPGGAHAMGHLHVPPSGSLRSDRPPAPLEAALSGPMTDPGMAHAVPVPRGAVAEPPARAAAETAVSAYEAATGAVEITPSQVGSADVWMAGFAMSHPVARGTVRPLYARCLTLYDQGVPAVLVTLDVLGIPASLNAAIREGMAELGVFQSDLLLAATHTHSGPVLADRLDPEISYALTASEIAEVQGYTDWLAAAVVQLVKDTLAAPRTEVSVSYGVGTANEATNREGLPYTDPAVPTLVVRASAEPGRVVALVFGYACHPVTRGFDLLYDADFPGVAQDLLERAFPGTVTFFLTGAAGDQNPSGTLGPILLNRVGVGVHNAVISALQGQMTTVSGPLRTDLRTIEMPLDLGPLDQLRDTYVTRRDADPGGTTPRGRHAQKMIDAIDAESLPTTISLPLQLWTFTGSPQLRIIAIGGEVVSGYAVYFKERFGGNSQTWVAGYANENPCYVVSDELLRRGGYAAGYDTEPHAASIQGSMLFYGWPCRLRGLRDSVDGVEQLIINTVTSMIAEV